MTNKIRKRDLRVFKNMEDSIKELGLNIIESDSSGDPLYIESGFEYASYSIGILVGYHPKDDLVSLGIIYGEMPADKIEPLIRLVNHVNKLLVTSHYAIDPESGKMILGSGMYINGHLDKVIFKKHLDELMSYSFKFTKLIAMVLTSDKDPAEIVKEIVIMPDMEGEVHE